MNISAILQRLTGNKGSDEADGCPDESRILSYTDGRLSASDRPGIQMHLAKCDDCRELVAVAVRESPAEARLAEPVSEREVKQQTARVLAYIELDKSNQTRGNTQTTKRPDRTRTSSRLSYPRLSSASLASAALVVCAVAGGSVWLLSQDDSNAKAMKYLAVAMKDERRNPVLISGDVPDSRCHAIRGDEVSDDVQYERALNKVADKASVESRHIQARVLLAMAKRDQTLSALAILEKLEASGEQSAELLNDLGVAHFGLGNYETAAQYFRTAREKAPGDTRILFNKAFAEQRAEHPDEAKRDWNQYLDTASDERLKAEARSKLDTLR